MEVLKITKDFKLIKEMRDKVLQIIKIKEPFLKETKVLEQVETLVLVVHQIKETISNLYKTKARWEVLGTSLNLEATINLNMDKVIIKDKVVIISNLVVNNNLVETNLGFKKAIVIADLE